MSTKTSITFQGGKYKVECGDCGGVHSTDSEQEATNKLLIHLFDHYDEIILTMAERIMDLENRLDMANL